MRNVPLSLRNSAVLAAALVTLCGVSLSAAPLNNWTQNSGTNISGLDTNHPVVGTGVADSIKSQQMYATTTGYTLDNVGDSLSFTGKANFQGVGVVQSDQFRFGVYDSNGSTTVSGWLGYFVGNASGTSADARSRLWKRPDPNNISFGSNGWTNPSPAAAAGSWTSAPANAFGSGDYSFSMVLTKTADGIAVNWSLIGLYEGATYSIIGSYLDTSPNATTFDRVGIFVGGGISAELLSFSDMDLTFSPAIPEPATTAAIAGLAILGFAMLRRRCRR